MILFYRTKRETESNSPFFLFFGKIMSGVLSDNEIKFAMDVGDIVIQPFNEKNLGNCSYDVCLGKYYYQAKPVISQNVINPFSPSDVSAFWGNVLDASFRGRFYFSSGFQYHSRFDGRIYWSSTRHHYHDEASLLPRPSRNQYGDRRLGRHWLYQSMDRLSFQ